MRFINSDFGRMRGFVNEQTLNGVIIGKGNFGYLTEGVYAYDNPKPETYGPPTPLTPDFLQSQLNDLIASTNTAPKVVTTIAPRVVATGQSIFANKTLLIGFVLVAAATLAFMSKKRRAA
jgi:hypothetical protein